MEVIATLPRDTSQDVEIEYYVVQDHKVWYGPMKLKLKMNTSPSSSHKPSPSLAHEESSEICQSSSLDSYKFKAKVRLNRFMSRGLIRWC